MPLAMMYGMLQIELHKNKLYCEEYKIYKGYKPSLREERSFFNFQWDTWFTITPEHCGLVAFVILHISPCHSVPYSSLLETSIFVGISHIIHIILVIWKLHPSDMICSYRWLQMVCSWCFSSSTNSWRALMWPCVVMANLAYLIRKNNNDIMPLNPSLWPNSWHWFNRFILFLYNYLTANILHPSKNDYC